MAHFQYHTVAEKPFQRQFIDGLGPLAPNPAVVMPGRINMGAGMVIVSSADLSQHGMIHIGEITQGDKEVILD